MIHGVRYDELTLFIFLLEKLFNFIVADHIRNDHSQSSAVGRKSSEIEEEKHPQYSLVTYYTEPKSIKKMHTKGKNSVNKIIYNATVYCSLHVLVDERK